MLARLCRRWLSQNNIKLCAELLTFALAGYERLNPPSKGLKELYFEVFDGIIMDDAKLEITDSVMTLDEHLPSWRGGNNMCKIVEKRKEVAFHIHKKAAALRNEARLWMLSLAIESFVGCQPSLSSIWLKILPIRNLAAFKG